MSVYVVTHKSGGPFYVVRTTDMLILAECADSVVADQITSLLNQYAV